MNPNIMSFSEHSCESWQIYLRMKPKCFSPGSTRGEWTVALCLGVIHAVVVNYVNKIVPEPYMDEIFHIRQTRRYCSGDYTWDPMITTPPLLYIISMPLCGYERYINSFIIPFTFIGCCRLRRLFSSTNVILPSLSVIFLPVLFHSSFLFYTDLLSLCLVVWAFSIPSINISSFIFFLSLFCRQTNIVWAGLYASSLLFRRFNPKQPLLSIFNSLLSLIPYILVAICFLAFVFLNGGIVLGDPSAHQPLPHFSQLLYLSLFCCLHTWPSLLLHSLTLAKTLVNPRNFLLLIPICLVIHFFSFSHPYLLADNRHIPFYLWRWCLSVPSRRLTLAPLYLCALLSMNTLSKHISPILRLLFFFCSIAVVVPAHLIEPRYFIIPYTLWRLTAHTPSKLLSFVEIVSQLFIFSILFYLFLFKPFEWINEPGISQRFMW